METNKKVLAALKNIVALIEKRHREECCAYDGESDALKQAREAIALAETPSIINAQWVFFATPNGTQAKAYVEKGKILQVELTTKVPREEYRTRIEDARNTAQSLFPQ